jgi:hypothetical protein
MIASNNGHQRHSCEVEGMGPHWLIGKMIYCPKRWDERSVCRVSSPEAFDSDKLC